MAPTSDRKERRSSEEEEKAFREGMEEDQAGKVSTPALDNTGGVRVKKGYFLDKARRQKARVKFVKSEDGGLRSNNVAGVNEEERGDEEENPEDIPLPETSQSFQDSSKEENNSNVSVGIAKLKSSMADEENWCSFESDTS